MKHPINPKLRMLALTLALSISPLLFAANLVRGPYLQIVTPTSIVIKWRTDVPTDAIVQYGLAANNLTDAAIDVAIDVDHEVIVTGLTPAMLYYYSVGDSAATLAGGANSYKFQTAPSIGARHPTRIWVIGDSGTANSNAAAVPESPGISVDLAMKKLGRPVDSGCQNLTGWFHLRQTCPKTATQSRGSSLSSTSQGRPWRKSPSYPWLSLLREDAKSFAVPTLQP